MNDAAQKFSESRSSVFEESEKAIQVHPWSLDSYQHEVIYGRINQIVDPNNPLRDFD